MDSQITKDDLKKIEAGIREKYNKVAQSPEGQFKYPYSRNHDNIGCLKKNGAIVVNSPVVIDDRIISCSGPGSAIDVAFLLMEQLLDSKTTQEVRKFMIYKK